MAVTSNQVAVTSAATLIVPASNLNVLQSEGGYQLANRDVFISNGSGATVFLGGTSAVTTLTGCPLAASTTLKMQLHLDEAIYAIVASTGSTVSFLAAGS